MTTTAETERRAERRSDSLDAGEAITRQLGRAFVLALYKALRSLKLYPIENEQVQVSLDELTAATKAAFEHENELELRATMELMFVNGTRLRLEMDIFASFTHVLDTFHQSGVGVMNILEVPERREWQVFVSSSSLTSLTVRRASGC